jgi:adenosine deaminase
MNDNFVQTFEATGLTAQQAYVLARNSFEASFVPETQKQTWRKQLDDCFKLYGV